MMMNFRSTVIESLNATKKKLLEKNGFFDDNSMRKKLENKFIVDSLNLIEIEKLELLLAPFDDKDNEILFKILGNHFAAKAMNDFSIEKLKLLLQNKRIRFNILKGLLGIRDAVYAINDIDFAKLKILLRSVNFNFDYKELTINKVPTDIVMYVFENRDYVNSINKIDIEKLEIIFDMEWENFDILRSILQNEEIITVFNLIELERLKILFKTVDRNTKAMTKLIRLFHCKNAIYAITSLDLERFKILFGNLEIYEKIEELFEIQNLIDILQNIDIERLRSLFEVFYTAQLIRLFENENSVKIINSIENEKSRILFKKRSIVRNKILEGLIESKHCEFIFDFIDYEILAQISDYDGIFFNKDDRNNNFDDHEKYVKHCILLNSINSLDETEIKIIVQNLYTEESLLMKILLNPSYVNAIKLMDNNKLSILLKSHIEIVDRVIEVALFPNLVNGINEIDPKRFDFILPKIDYFELVNLLTNQIAVNEFNLLNSDKFQILFFNQLINRNLMKLLERKNSAKIINNFETERLEILLEFENEFLKELDKPRVNRILSFIDIEKFRIIIKLSNYDINQVFNSDNLFFNENYVNLICTMDNERLYYCLQSPTIRKLIIKGLIDHPFVEGIRKMNFVNFRLFFNYEGKLLNKLTYSSYEFVYTKENLNNLFNIFRKGNIIDCVNKFDFEKLIEVFENCDLRSLQKIMENPWTIHVINERFDERKFKIIIENIDFYVKKGIFNNRVVIDAINSISSEKFQLLYDLNILEADRLITVLENQNIVGAINSLNLEKLLILTSNITEPSEIMEIFESTDVNLRRNLNFSIALFETKRIESFNMEYLRDIGGVFDKLAEIFPKKAHLDQVRIESAMTDDGLVLHLKYLCIEKIIHELSSYQSIT